MRINEQNYVDEAEKVIKKLKAKTDKNGRSVPMVTTSKLRNLLALTADIYNEVMNGSGDKLSEEICSRIEYLRVRFLYEAGREPAVKSLVEEAGLLDVLKDIKGSKKGYILFNRYMEALVAFHKYHGGRDN
ncbi:MAG: type III-A CRISPR-associated protein Csm2 [Roseburia sp.]|nr:type III-A CRISPR-associated protein Csm2 [Roseburia sp.]